MDPDLWWHITVGRWIIEHKSLPHQDYWNMFGHGQPWRAYSWSNEVIFAFVDSHFGIYGLLSLKLFLALCLAASLFWVMSKISSDWFFGGLLGIFSTAACFNHFTLRPQCLVWIYFALVIYICTLIERQGQSRKLLLSLTLIMCLWANTHITSVLGIGVIVAWLFRASDWKQSLKPAGFAFLGTLITPYLGGEWITFISKSGHPFDHRAIAEFQSATVMQHSTAFLLIVSALLLCFWHLRPKTLEVLKMLCAGAFILGSLAVVKFLPFAVILVAALVAEFWWREAKNRTALGNLAEGFERSRALFSKIPAEGLSFVFMCLSIVNFMPLWSSPISHEITPVKAMDFIIDYKLPFPLLNDFGRGGYVMYRLSNQAGELEHLVSIDGRTNITPQEIWEKSQASFLGKASWRDYINSVHPKTILWPTESPLSAILLNAKEFCRVFQSGSDERGYSVFVSAAELPKLDSKLSSENCQR